MITHQPTVRRAAAIMFLLLSGFVSVVQADQPQKSKPAIVLTIQGKTLTVSGVIAGASIVIYGIGQESHRYWTSQLRQSSIIIADSTGTATLSLANDVPWMSVWAAVDLDSGAATIATPRDFPRRELDFPAATLKRDKDGVIDRFDTGRQSVEILCVRPGKGAWEVTNGVASANNDPVDGKENNRTVTAFANMRPLGGSPKSPKNLQKGDLIFVIDPMSLEFYSSEVAE